MTSRNRVRLSQLSIGLIAALAAAPVFAQSTSAGVGGLVTDSGGQPVGGAEVVITHVESGTVSRATTTPMKADMSPGGPIANRPTSSAT